MIRTEIVNVTPSVAKEFLTHNPTGDRPNRALKPRKIKQFAEDMKTNNWVFNGEPIIFKENGDLFDGQNRLHAVIASGESVPMLVVYGVDNNVIICDKGTPRSTHDVLRMDGYKDLGTVYATGTMKFLLRMIEKGLEQRDSVVLEFAEDYGEQISTACRIAITGRNHPIGRKSSCAAAAFCALMAGVDENLLVRFFTTMNTGFYDNASQSSAIVLRNMILDLRRTGGQDKQEEIFALTTAAIHDFALCIPRQRKYPLATKPDKKYWNYTRAYILSKYAYKK